MNRKRKASRKQEPEPSPPYVPTPPQKASEFLGLWAIASVKLPATCTIEFAGFDKIYSDTLRFLLKEAKDSRKYETLNKIFSEIPDNPEWYKHQGRPVRPQPHYNSCTRPSEAFCDSWSDLGNDAHSPQMALERVLEMLPESEKKKQVQKLYEAFTNDCLPALDDQIVNENLWIFEKFIEPLRRLMLELHENWESLTRWDDGLGVAELNAETRTDEPFNLQDAIKLLDADDELRHALTQEMRVDADALSEREHRRWEQQGRQLHKLQDEIRKFGSIKTRKEGYAAAHRVGLGLHRTSGQMDYAFDHDVVRTFLQGRGKQHLERGFLSPNEIWRLLKIEAALPNQKKNAKTAPPQSGSQKSKREVLSGEARALGLLAEHSDWTNIEIAKAAGLSRTTLYDYPKFKQAREAQKKGKRSRGRAIKDKRTERMDATSASSEE